jgi:Protein of unknown function (DUF962)
MQRFLDALREQRWDDHRFYHHSRVNQTLHFISASSFLVTYFLLFTKPTIAVIFGWTFAMVSRQVGHFFFEPRGYDDVNQATHEYKEKVKAGFNLRRKVILHSVWGAIPLLLLVSPSFFGLFTDSGSYFDHLATLWLWLAGGALVGRTVYLFFIRDVMTGLVWFTKILTDPFNDFWQYRSAPGALLRGERLDPMSAG